MRHGIFCTSFSICLALAGVAGPVHASTLSIVEYTYSGNTLVLDDPEGVGEMSGYANTPTLPGISLGFAFDEHLYGRSLAGHTVEFSNYVAGIGLPQLTMIDPTGNVSLFGPFETDPSTWKPFLDVRVFGTYQSRAILGSCSLSFDANADVAAHSCISTFDVTGANEVTETNTQGDRYNAPFSEIFFEGTDEEVFFEGEYFAQPGTWSKEIVERPAPVPLPASFGFLLAGILLPATFGLRRRHQKQPV